MILPVTKAPSHLEEGISGCWRNVTEFDDKLMEHKYF
jgi:hypothetical protein